MDGILNITYFRELRAQGMNVAEAVFQGAEQRMRPMLMTALSAGVGLDAKQISPLQVQTNREREMTLLLAIVDLSQSAKTTIRRNFRRHLEFVSVRIFGGCHATCVTLFDPYQRREDA